MLPRAAGLVLGVLPVLAAGVAVLPGCSHSPSEPPAAVCTVSPTALSFGSVVMGDSADRVFTVGNPGEGTAGMWVASSSPAFRVVGERAFTLAPGASKSFTLRFVPDLVGAWACTLSVHPPGCRMPASGTCVPVPQPRCEVLPARLDLGPVVIGGSVLGSFSVGNAGTAPLGGALRMVCGAFRNTGSDSFDVAPGASARVTVEFSPKSVGLASCSVTFPPTECGPVLLTGTGLPLPAPGYLAWGRRGTGDGELQGPMYVAAGPSGDVYVSDTASARVQRFTRDGVFVRGYGSQGGGPGHFMFPPSGITVDGREHLYVLDPANGLVHEFGPDGALVSAWRYQGTLSPALALATDSDTLLYMLTNMSLEVRGPTAGTLRSLRLPWPVPEAPRALAADRDGRVLVADPEHRVVWVYRPVEGAWATWGLPCVNSRPSGVTLDAAGLAYVLDAAPSEYDICDQAVRLWRMDAGGAVTGQWGLHGAGSPGMIGPASAAAGPDGCVYLADPARDKVHRVPVALMGAFP
jgi:DNA-binding beta-propeller fold protein YncE